MFGLSDNSDKNNTAAPAVDSHDPMGFANDPAQDSGMPPAASGGLDAPAAMPPQPVPPPPLMPGPASTTDTDTATDASEANPYPTQPAATEPKNDSPAPSTSTPPALESAHEDKLLKLKQDALTSLAPLVDHLDQTPEEKFKTTMMLIQASDNAELIPEAHAAANKITDEKVRAQALLDVVNEINYFTHRQQQASEN